jgi:hypothetical protein
MRHVFFLFGEAERGEYCTPVLCQSLPELADTLGNPPEETLGIFYGVQALMHDRDLIFFRVREEGFSTDDYMRGLKLLEDKESISSLSAICMPGVGDTDLINVGLTICSLHASLLILTQADLYDYLTGLN